MKRELVAVAPEIIRSVVAGDVQFREAGHFNQDFNDIGNILYFQDPSVASVTNNAARGLEDFNPFEDQNKSQASGSKVGHFLRAYVSFCCVWFIHVPFVLILGLSIAILSRGSKRIVV